MSLSPHSLVRLLSHRYRWRWILEANLGQFVQAQTIESWGHPTSVAVRAERVDGWETVRLVVLSVGIQMVVQISERG